MQQAKAPAACIGWAPAQRPFQLVLKGCGIAAALALLASGTIPPALAQVAPADPPTVAAAANTDAGVLLLQDRAMLARLTAGTMHRLRFANAPLVMPDVTLRDLAGRTTPLSHWRGRFLLINVWASWCAPCREEIPALDRLVARLEPGSIAVVTLGIDKVPDKATRFLADLGLTRLPLYVDPELQATRSLGVAGAPTSLLIDPMGRELARSEGSMHWDSDDALLLLKALSLKWQAAQPTTPR